MLGLYVNGEVPFKHVLFHGLVNDPYGKKMSKSKGNVVNPLELIEQYGADAVRFALIYGNATGNDQSLSYPKLDSARKFTNKLWNIGRFITLCHPEERSQVPSGTWRSDEGSRDVEELLKLAKNENDKQMIGETQKLIKEVTKDLENYNFNFAAEKLYNFTWHEFADKYIEEVKIHPSASLRAKVKSLDQDSFMILNSLFMILLKLLHPFMPFVTEEIYQRLGGNGSIMIERWPS